MSKKFYKVLSLAILAIFITGCSKEAPRYVGVDNPNVQEVISMGLDRQDFEKAASDSIESLLRSGVLNKQNGDKYVVAISRVVNDTTQRIDTDLLVKKIRISLLNSGKAVVTSAISANGNDDQLVYDTRDLRADGEFNSSTIAGKGTLLAPELSLSGKIIQQTKRVDKNALVDYYFQLTLTNLTNGLAIWEGETIVAKVGDRKSVNW